MNNIIKYILVCLYTNIPRLTKKHCKLLIWLCISVLHIYITNIYVNTHLHKWNTDIQEERITNKRYKELYNYIGKSLEPREF